jgi:hypothetical protein
MTRAIIRLAAAAVLLAPGAASGAGAWRTYVRPSSFAAVVAEGDTVWCASRDAGLLAFSTARRTFVSNLHEPNGLASNGLTALALDRSRRMWLGTNGTGVSVLAADRGSWTLVNHIDGLPSDAINTLTAQGDSMWIGTTAGLAVWDGDEISGHLPDGSNAPFANDNTSGGIYTALQSQRLETWTQANVGLISLAVTRLVDNGATLFAVASRAMHRWDPPGSRWVALSGIGNVLSAAESRGQLFAGTNKGIYRWSGAAWTVVDTTLKSSDDSPFAIGLDDDGRIRAAGRPLSSPTASGTGLYSQPATGTTWTFDWPVGPPGNNDVGLGFDGDRVYVTTLGNGIGRLIGEQWTNWFPTATPVQSDTTFRRPLFTYSMLVDKQSHKWFAEWAPLGPACQPDSSAYEILDDRGAVNSVRRHLYGTDQDSARLSFAWGASLDSGLVVPGSGRTASGGHWFGLASPCPETMVPAGLLYFADDVTAGQSFDSNDPATGLSSSLVWAIATDRRARVWVGTNLGLCYFDTLLASGPVVRRLKDAQSYSVRALATRSDTLWVLIPGKLYQYGITGANLGYYDVLSSVSTLAIHPMDVGRDGTLWLGTSDGVIAYHPGRNRPETFTTTNSPLADNDVRSLRVDRRTGYVWIATGAGLSRYDPGYVAASARLPSLSLQAYPNPSRLTALGVTLKLGGNGTAYAGAIYDLLGRRVSRFSVLGNGRMVWNGRDERDELVTPGIYFLRAESGGRSAVVRVVLLR